MKTASESSRKSLQQIPHTEITTLISALETFITKRDLSYQFTSCLLRVPHLISKAMSL